MRVIDALVVHCSATMPSMDIGVQEIREWHLARGFTDIGYHFVIRRDGRRELGRPIEQIGAHVLEHNATTIGVCLVGGVDEHKQPQANFMPEQYAELTNLLNELHAQFPHAQILGHRDFPHVAKACPSFDVRSWYAEHNMAAGGV